MRDQEELFKFKTINGKKVQIHLLGGLDGLERVQEVSPLLIPIFGIIQGSTAAQLEEGIEQKDLKIDFMSIGKSFVLNMKDIGVRKLVEDLLEGMAVDDNPIKDLNDYFAGNYAELIAFTAFAIQENFGSFLETPDMFK